MKFDPVNRSFPCSPGPLFQNEGRCSAFDMEIIFHSRANKTHFHKKGFAPSLILKVRVWELESGLFFACKLIKGNHTSFQFTRSIWN